MKKFSYKDYEKSYVSVCESSTEKVISPLLVSSILAKIHSQKQLSLLELGIGNGEMTSKIIAGLNPNIKLTGIDINQISLQLCEKKLGWMTNKKFSQQNFLSKDILKMEFNTTLILNSLYNFSFEEISKLYIGLVKKGCIISIHCTNKPDSFVELRSLFGARADKNISGRDNESILPPEIIDKLSKKHGFNSETTYFSSKVFFEVLSDKEWEFFLNFSKYEEAIFSQPKLYRNLQKILFIILKMPLEMKPFSQWGCFIERLRQIFVKNQISDYFTYTEDTMALQLVSLENLSNCNINSQEIIADGEGEFYIAKPWIR